MYISNYFTYNMNRPVSIFHGSCKIMLYRYIRVYKRFLIYMCFIEMFLEKMLYVFIM